MRYLKDARKVWQMIKNTNVYRQNQLSRSHWEKWKCKYREYKFSCSVPFPRAIGRGNYLEEGDLKLMHTLHNQLYSLHCPTKQKCWKSFMFYVSLAIFLLISYTKKITDKNRGNSMTSLDILLSIVSCTKKSLIKIGETCSLVLIAVN